MASLRIRQLLLNLTRLAQDRALPPTVVASFTTKHDASIAAMAQKQNEKDKAISATSEKEKDKDLSDKATSPTQEKEKDPSDKATSPTDQAQGSTPESDQIAKTASDAVG